MSAVTRDRRVAALLDRIQETLSMWPDLTPKTELFAALNLHRRTAELVAVIEAREEWSNR